MGGIYREHAIHHGTDSCGDSGCMGGIYREHAIHPGMWRFGGDGENLPCPSVAGCKFVPMFVPIYSLEPPPSTAPPTLTTSWVRPPVPASEAGDPGSAGQPGGDKGLLSPGMGTNLQPMHPLVSLAWAGQGKFKTVPSPPYRLITEHIA